MRDLFMVLFDKCFFIDTIFLQHCNTSFCMKRLLLHWWDSGTCSLVYGQEWNGICFVAVLGKNKIEVLSVLINFNWLIIFGYYMYMYYRLYDLKCASNVCSLPFLKAAPLYPLTYHSIFTLNISCFNLHVSVDFTSHKFRFCVLNTCT